MLRPGALLRGELLDLRAVEPERWVSVRVVAVAVERRPSSSWLERARCKGMDTSWWFPNRGDQFAGRVAVQVCAGCPVRRECLESALVEELAVAGEPSGIRGGKTAQQREMMLRQRRDGFVPS